MSWAATAVVGSSVVSGYLQKEAAGEAAGAQVQAAQMDIESREKMFEAVQALLAPYVETGTKALGGQAALLGLEGPEAQKVAIRAIEGSPEFGAMVTQGEEGILQTAAATGGVRGGNVAGTLAQFRPQVLSNLIQQRFQNLGGIARLGQASAAGVGVAGQETAAGIGAAYQGIGAARAGEAIAKGQAFGNVAQTGQTLATLKLMGAF